MFFTFSCMFCPAVLHIEQVTGLESCHQCQRKLLCPACFVIDERGAFKSQFVAIETILSS